MVRFKKKKGAPTSNVRRGAWKSVVARVVLVLVALVVCALLPIFVNNVIGYLPLLALVLMLVVSFVYLQIIKRGFSFSEDSLAPTCERGSDIDFVLMFNNASPLPLMRLDAHIYISDLFDDVDTVTPVSMTLMPHENHEFRFQARFDHIGTYAAGVQKIQVNDLLGLFTYTIVNEKRHRVDVLPRLFDTDKVVLSSEVSSESQKPKQALTVDDMDYAGVREYTWGDPIKTIHWKLSAQNPSGEYLTRLFETFNNPGIAIILDTSSPDYDKESLMCVFDGIVESGLSVNQYAISRGIDSVLEFNDKYGSPSKLRLLNAKDFSELTNVLPRIKPGDGSEAIELLRREGSQLHGQDNIAFCTSQVNEEVVSLLISLKLRKRNPVLLLTVPPSMDSQQVKEFTRPLRRLDEAGITRLVISSASQLGTEPEA